MHVHGSTSHYSNNLFKSQSNTSSDDSTPFVLPDSDSNGQQQQTRASSTTTTSSANSISSAFWLNQSGASSDATTDDATADTDADTAATDDADSASASDTSSADLLSEFAKLANMTPAEKIRDQYLKQHNMTEEQFSQLSPDEQKAINDQIADEIKQQLGASKNGGGNSENDAASALSMV